MVENGFFCLFPDDESYAKLALYCKEPHISILVIEDAKEITRMKELIGCRLEAEPIHVTVLRTHTLHSRAGLEIPVLQITQEECQKMKAFYVTTFELKSDVYGASQDFHVSVDIATNEANELVGETLTFDKCTFSTRMVGVPGTKRNPRMLSCVKLSRKPEQRIFQVSKRPVMLFFVTISICLIRRRV